MSPRWTHRTLRVLVAAVLVLAIGWLSWSWYLRVETEWFEASMRARVAVHQRLPPADVAQVYLQGAGRHKKQCYPTLPSWIVARARGPLDTVEATAFEVYLRCLKARTEPPDRGWSPPPAGRT